MTGWVKVRLSDVADVNARSIDRTFPHSEILYIDISAVGEGYVSQAPERISLNLAPSRARRLLSSGDTVISSVRPANRSMFFADDPGFDWVVSTGFSVLTPRVGMVVPKFLYYSVFDRGFTNFLVSQEKGAAYPAVSPSDIINAKILLPPYEVQISIAKILGALDDKIESNLRRIQIQNELVALEFQRVLAANELFFVPLSEVAELTKGVSYKSVDLKPSKTCLVTLKSIDRNGGYKSNGLKQYVGPYKHSQVVQPGEVVVAQTDLTQGAEVVGRAVRVPGSDKSETLVASLDLVIARPKGEMPSEYLLGVMTQESFRQHCRNRTNGTTVLHLASDAIPSYLAPIVPASAQETFARFSSTLHASVDSLTKENSILSSLRDTLLSALLSGRIKPDQVA